MNNKKLKKYILKNYYKDNQVINIQSFTDIEESIKQENFYGADLFYKDYCFLDIQCLDVLDRSEVGHTPYCLKYDWGYVITVQRFGQINKKDIHNAINYVLSLIMGECIFYNTVFEGEIIRSKEWRKYEHSNDSNYMLDECIRKSKNIKEDK